MNWNELTHLTKTPCLNSGALARVRTSEEGIDGMEHPLWTAMNTVIPPPRPWRRIKGSERGQIRRAAALLDEAGIPYTFYANFLLRFGKGYLKQSSALPIMVTKSKGNTPILLEYLELMKLLRACFDSNPDVISVVDAIYKTYPLSYRAGVQKYIDVVKLIDSVMPKYTYRQMVQMLDRSDSLDAFIQRFKEVVKFKEVDLSKGLKADNVPLLQKEMRVRTGRDIGTPNPDLNKYFTKKGRLNTRGLALIGM